MTETVETIIVGGGMAGMTCALKLQDEGRPYLIITEDMGVVSATARSTI